MPLDPDKLAIWKAIAEAASPGDWRVGRKVYRTVYADERLIGMMDRPEDARLAAVAREALPALVGEIERLTERAESVHAAWHAGDAARREEREEMERLRAEVERLRAAAISAK